MRIRPRAAARVRGALIALVLLLGLGGMPLSTSALALRPLTSLGAVESQVMCATCKIPLIVAESPQANRERAFIKTLIGEGRSLAQIKRALVFQYGAGVLALPSTHGFGLFAYLVPILVALAILVMLALLVPRWRRRGRSLLAASTPAPIDPSDASRLERDMERFD